MGQITHETVKCIEDYFARKVPDGGFPLTSWEKVQLARAWELLQIINEYGISYSTAELSDPRRPYGISVSLPGQGCCGCYGTTPIEAAQSARDWLATARQRQDAAGVNHLPGSDLDGGSK